MKSDNDEGFIYRSFSFVDMADTSKILPSRAIDELAGINTLVGYITLLGSAIFPESEDKRILQNLTSFSLNRSF